MTPPTCGISSEKDPDIRPLSDVTKVSGKSTNDLKANLDMLKLEKPIKQSTKIFFCRHPCMPFLNFCFHGTTKDDISSENFQSQQEKITSQIDVWVINWVQQNGSQYKGTLPLRIIFHSTWPLGLAEHFLQ